MHQQGIEGVAGGGALHLGVVDEGQGTHQIGTLVHENMADAESADDDGDGAVLLAHLVQPGAAAGNDHVHVAVEAQQLTDQSPVRVVDVLYRCLGQTWGGQRTLDHPHQLQVGVEGLAAAAQYAGVAGLEAEAGDIDGNVGARLVNHADDADGHPAAGETQAVLQYPAVDLGPHGVIQGDHLAHVSYDAGQTGRIEQQPIQHGLRQPRLAPCSDVLLVGSQDLGASRLQFVGDGSQRPILLCRADGGQLIGGLTGRLPHFFQTHDCSLLFMRCCTDHSSTISSRWMATAP